MRAPRRQHGQERVKTVQRQALRGLALRLLPAHRGRRRGRRDRVPRLTIGLERLVRKQERRPRLPEMPFHVVREEAEKDVRPDVGVGVISLS